MATPTGPSTPQAVKSTPPVGTPGSWRHPRLNEINRRIAASTFTSRNLNIILSNIGALGLTHIAPRFLNDWLPNWYGHIIAKYLFKSYIPLTNCNRLTTPLAHHDTTIRLFFSLIFLFNIAVASLPLLRGPDNCNDIPLTPGQRKLLGLRPSDQPATPGSEYITPPRYAANAASRSGSGGLGRSGSGRRAASPYGGSPTPGPGKDSQSPLGMMQAGPRSPSPYTPTGSPYLRNTLKDSAHRRHSFDKSQSFDKSFESTAVPFSRSNALAMEASLMSGLGNSVPGTPTPGSGGKVPSVGITNKWLYDRNSPGRRGLFSG
jgi:nucleoporin POM34